MLLLGSGACQRNQEIEPVSILNGETGDLLERKLTPAVEKVVEQYDLPGIAIGVVRQNEIVYARAFGYSNCDTGEPLSIHSLFHMASISKTFVVTAVMQLVEQGKIDLDAALVDYLPYFRMSGPYQDITIRQILSHISGMPDVRENKWDHPVNHQRALEQYVRSLASETMVGVPGDRFYYSNMAFDCLGEVVARVSGMPFEKYIEKRVLDPIGMEASSFLKPESLPRTWASPHRRVITSRPWDQYPYNRMHGPSSTMHSSVVEMCRWAMTNMNRGSYGKQRILESSTYDLLWEPVLRVTGEWEIGLCWFMRNFKNAQTIWHSGGDTGFSTVIEMIPDHSMAVVVLCNLNPAPVDEIKSMALDILLGFEPETPIIPATIPVFKELEANGPDAAVKLWDSLKVHFPEEYDFGPRHLNVLLYAMEMGMVDEAASISRLCLKIYPEEVIDDLVVQTERYYDRHHRNIVAPAILEILNP